MFRRPSPLAWLAGVLLLLSLLLPAPTLAGPAPPRIMPIGDQLTTGVNHSGGYRVWLRDLIEYGDPYSFVGSRVDNPVTGVMRHEGHAGYTIGQLRTGVRGWLTANPPDVVLLLAGINDLLGWRSAADTAAQMGLLLDAIRASSSTTIIVGTVPPNARVPSAKLAQFNALLPSVIAGRPGVLLVDTAAAIVPADWQADGKTPFWTYYQHLAQAFYDRLEGAGIL